MRSDVTTSATHAAHAQAWASATVTSSGVTKSASGNGWLDATAPTVKAETWSSSASGSQYVVGGSPGQIVPFQFQTGIPSALGNLHIIGPGPDGTGYDITQQDATHDIALPAVLSMKRTAIPTGNLFPAGAFDLNFSLDVEVTQNAVTTKIFNGQITFGLNGQTTRVGDFQNSAFANLLIADNQADGTLSAHFSDQFQFPGASVQALVPFDLTFIESMKMGDGSTVDLGSDPINNPTFNFSNQPNIISAEGSFTGTFFTTSGNTIMPVVPEPASIVLLGIGLLGFAGTARRWATV